MNLSILFTRYQSASIFRPTIIQRVFDWLGETEGSGVHTKQIAAAAVVVSRPVREEGGLIISVLILFEKRISCWNGVQHRKEPARATGSTYDIFGGIVKVLVHGTVGIAVSALRAQDCQSLGWSSFAPLFSGPGTTFEGHLDLGPLEG